MARLQKMDHWGGGWENVRTGDAESDSIMRWHGVKFYQEMLNGQCGAAILYDFSRVPMRAVKASDEFVSELRRAFKGRRALLIASAYKGTNLHKLLNREPWVKGPAKRNPNSGNTVQVFQLTVRP